MHSDHIDALFSVNSLLGMIFVSDIFVSLANAIEYVDNIRSKTVMNAHMVFCNHVSCYSFTK